MSKLFWIGVMLLSLGVLNAIAQAPSLDIFTSSDGTFRFVYPEEYELLVGESILKATQGRNEGIPVCDFSTALACVIYPIQGSDDTRFEGAGFSVGWVPGVNSESECLSYADQRQAAERENELTSVAINSLVFRHTSSKKKIPGHWQVADSYRTFKRGRCYVLQVEVSLSEGASTQKASRSCSLGDARATNARDSLQLILSSFAFTQD